MNATSSPELPQEDVVSQIHDEQSISSVLEHDSFGVHGESKFNGQFDEPTVTLNGIALAIEQNDIARGNESPVEVTLSSEKREGMFVRRAPRFSEQVDDVSRTNSIKYVQGQRNALSTETGRLGESATETEHQSLIELRNFLAQAAANTIDSDVAAMAASMLENLTFIGEKEYTEAAAGIAKSWRDQLDSNPDLQICAITGAIDDFAVKSDAYLLDNVLKNMSDEDLQRYQGRLILDPGDLTASADNVKLVVLDDWTISGNQLRAVCSNLQEEYPQYAQSIELQLVAATEVRVEKGLDLWPDSSSQWNADDRVIPVNAYYAAHAAKGDGTLRSGAHITGAHCAVDYDFNLPIAHMAQVMGVDMPPATNIIRPYRESGVKLKQRDRVVAPVQDEVVDNRQLELDDFYAHQRQQNAMLVGGGSF